MADSTPPIQVLSVPKGDCTSDMDYFHQKEVILEDFHQLTRLEHYRASFDNNHSFVKFRRIIVEWMNEVVEEFQLSRVTAHTAVNFLDRFLSTSSIANVSATCCDVLHFGCCKI